MASQNATAGQANTSARVSRLPSKRTLYMLFLLFLFVAYWIFVWRMERITLTPADMPLPILQGLPEWLINFMGIFMPRVLRHLIPIVLGWLLAYEIATNLVFHLYNLPDRATARGFLRRLRDPRRAGGAVIMVSPQDLESRRLDSARLRVGGPGRIAIPTGHAAVTELNGRFYRVIGSGGHALDRFEYVHSVFDLRPQERSDPEVKLYSREGLEVITDVGVTFRISAPEMSISVQQPYPYDSAVIHELAYKELNLPGGLTSQWEDAALSVVKGTLAASVSTFSLNELLQDEQTEIGAHLTIRQSVTRDAQAKLREQGIDLISVRIGGFQFPDDVTDLHIQYWRSFWDNRARLDRVEGEAIALEEMEIVRAETEIELVRAIAQSMHQARRQGYSGTMSEVIALRFVEALEKMALESESEIVLPEKLLPQLQSLQDQLQLVAQTSTTNQRAAPPAENSE